MSEALEAWFFFVRDPWHRLWDPSTSCGVMRCCPDMAQVRWILAVAVAALPARDARILRAEIAALEELW